MGGAQKALGILGGMGPQATVDFLQKVIDHTRAERDAEHMRIYVDNHPQIPDRISAVLEGAVDPLPALRESMRKLEDCGAGVIAMPCVTAHYFLPALREGCGVQFLSMLDTAAAACAARFPGGVAGVLSSYATSRSGLFTAALTARGIPFVEPDEADRRELGQLILEVKAAWDIDRTAGRFYEIVDRLQRAGAGYFVAACTELPIIVQQRPRGYPFVDPTAELARAAVTACGYPLKADDGAAAPPL